ncbi:MAG TPA: hypothetical protein VLG45_03860 [Thermodesulfobacteriota bacterium]|nr:hypothetical protein [Thermodesulfobacteriota bacterium]
MAEIWYLPIDSESTEGSEAQYERPLHVAIELLEITPAKWQCGTDDFPVLKTGDPLVDDSGYVYVMMRVGDDETAKYDDKRWKPGWYKSSLTIVGFEKNLRKKAK